MKDKNEENIILETILKHKNEEQKILETTMKDKNEERIGHDNGIIKMKKRAYRKQ